MYHALKVQNTVNIKVDRRIITMDRLQKTNALQERAMKSMPLGVNSNGRFWGKGCTPYFSRGKGSHMWDVDGNEYIDYRLGFGPVILGYAYDEVDNAVIE